MALGNIVMLLEDVADLAAEDSEEFGGKLIMMGAHVCCSSHSVLYFCSLSTLSDSVIFVYVVVYSACYVHFFSFEEHSTNLKKTIRRSMDLRGS